MASASKQGAVWIKSSIRSRLTALAVLLLATLSFQFASGAFTREFGGDPDEAAHYITAMMVHDYIASGAGQPPMRFAENFYAHYPKVAFAIWPPLFHVMEAGWMLVFSPSKASVLLLLALITTLAAYLLFRTVENLFGYAAGLCAGLFFISVPLVQQNTCMVMADNTVALFALLAMLRFARYLDEGRWQDAAWFGIWSSASILAKYNGLALAIVPLVAALLSRRWNILRRPQIWLAAAIAAILCGAWYLPMRQLVAYAAEPLPTLASILPATRMNSVALAGMMGVPLFAIVCAGAWLTLSGRTGGRGSDGLWISCAAVIVSFWLFHSLACPEPEPRYMLPALAPMILFLGAAIAGAVRMAGRPSLQRATLAIGAAALLYAAGGFHVDRIAHLGYSEVAEAIVSQPDLTGAIVMVDGTPVSEGMCVSEIAVRERRPGRYVLRGSKVLARTTWMGANYRALYGDTAGILDALDRAGVSVVILEADSAASLPHHKLLAEALRSDPESWQRWDDARWSASEKHFSVYRRWRTFRGDESVRIPLEYTLHRDMDVSFSDDGNPAAGAGNQ